MDLLINSLSTAISRLTEVILFILGYRLLVFALFKKPSDTAEVTTTNLVFRILPGAIFVILGVIIVFTRDQYALMIFFLLLPVLAGLCFAAMGYFLLVKGILTPSDFTAVWGNKKLLIKRAAPGTLFALFGAFLIVFSVWKGPALIEKSEQLQADQTKMVMDFVGKDVMPKLEKFIDKLLSTKKEEEN